MASFMLKQSRAWARHPYCTGMRILGAFALAAALVAQTPPQQTAVQKPSDQDMPAPIKVDVDVVSVLASVRDKRGGLVANLEKNDFTILEDGKPQTIKYFTKETDLPLTIGLLVDVSGSQRNLIEIERNAASQFFSQVLRKKDEAFLISFGEEAELLQDYTSSSRLLNAGLGELRVSSGVQGLHPGPVPTAGPPRGTVLYDAVYLAANDKLKGEVGRKVIVVITDGVDEGSRLTINQAIEAAQKSDAVIYSIEYYDPSAYGGFGGFGGFGGGGGEGALRKMSDETGGHVYKVDRKHTLDQVFKELQDEMRSQYAIGYTPANETKDGSYRKIDIKLVNKDLKAQARKGYYATRAEAR
jgi:VWFA-related protein